MAEKWRRRSTKGCAREGRLQYKSSVHKNIESVLQDALDWEVSASMCKPRSSKSKPTAESSEEEAEPVQRLRAGRPQLDREIVNIDRISARPTIEGEVRAQSSEGNTTDRDVREVAKLDQANAETTLLMNALLRQPRFQRPGCLKCGKTNHTTQECWKDIICQRCNRPGHPTNACFTLMCEKCGYSGHTASQGVCQYVKQEGDRHVPEFTSHAEGGSRFNRQRRMYPRHQPFQTMPPRHDPQQHQQRQQRQQQQQLLHTQDKRVCYICGQPGHLQRNCQTRVILTGSNSVPVNGRQHDGVTLDPSPSVVGGNFGGPKN